jgi:hypothetical protein
MKKFILSIALSFVYSQTPTPKYQPYQLCGGDNAELACPEGQTCCLNPFSDVGYYCYPVEEAVCCNDGKACPKGKKCAKNGGACYEEHFSAYYDGKEIEVFRPKAREFSFLNYLN